MTSPTARILGVDPGSLKCGWAIVGGSAARPELLEFGEVSLPATWSFERRLGRLHEAMVEIVASGTPTHAAVEAPFHGISARSALQLAHARGVVLAVLGAARVPVSEYAPATIKKAVTGSGRADKPQVTSMVRRLLRASHPSLREDVADATAAALCHLFRAGWDAKLPAMTDSDAR